MKIKSIAFLMAICMLFVVPLGGCGKKEEWEEYSDWVEVPGQSGQSGGSVSGGAASGDNSNGGGSAGNSGGNTTNNGNSNKQPSSNGITVDISGKDPNANYNVSGEVTVSVNTSRATDYEAVFDSFQTVYKNVKLKVDYFSDSTDGSQAYILRQASVGKLPDVVFDDSQTVPLYVSQGLAYPLDNYVNNDPDIQYVPTAILDSYKYGGKLYALPNSVHFFCVQLNLDAINELNLKNPSLSWTVSDFTNFLKDGTTSKFSGCEQLFGNETLAATLAPVYDSNVTIHGYNTTTNQFSLSSMVKGLQTMTELRKYPGLEAFMLRQSGTEAYSAKFGSSNLSDSKMALKLGRTLVELDVGTWTEPLLSNYKFSTTLWPFPQPDGNAGRMPIHVDHSFMTSSTKNPDAAFQLLRFVTYSTEGNLARLSMYDSENKDRYVLNSKFFIPVTRNPDVIAKFNTLNVDQVIQYFYDNIDKCYRADPKKFVPGFDDIIRQNAIDEYDKVTEGLADVNTVCAAMEPKLNTAISNYLSDFNTKLKNVQSEFDSNH